MWFVYSCSHEWESVLLKIARVTSGGQLDFFYLELYCSVIVSLRITA